MFAPAKMVARRAVRAVEAANAAIIMRKRGRRHERQQAKLRPLLERLSFCLICGLGNLTLGLGWEPASKES